MQIAIAILSGVSSVASAITAIVTFVKSECMIKLAADPKNEMLLSTYNTLTEEVLNAYDEACAKYNDNKVDKERFKKMYFHEIRQLVEDQELNEKYNNVSSILLE